MPQDDPESEDREEITDPVFIEYRDGLFYCIEEDQQPAEIEAEIQRLGSRVQCLICHRCHPITRMVQFNGQRNVDTTFYYMLYTCRTPVEQGRAEQSADSNSDDDFI